MMFTSIFVIAMTIQVELWLILVRESKKTLCFKNLHFGTKLAGDLQEMHDISGVRAPNPIFSLRPCII